MYQKYQTDALVLGSRESGENDRVFALFTREFGLVRARASSVRSEKSRMRYALQNYSRVGLSLVRGKRGWRAAGAFATKGATGGPKNVAVFARIAELTTRLVHGEEKNEYLFAVLAETHDALMSTQGRFALGGRDILPTIEIVCVARVLYALGYLSAEALETALFTHTAYAPEHVREAEEKREKLLSSINRAIAETHL